TLSILAQTCLRRHLHNESTNAWLFRCPRSSDVENFDSFGPDEHAQFGRWIGTGVGGQMQAGLAIVPGKLRCLFRSARQRRHEREDDSSIRVPHVPFCSLNVIARWRFLQPIPAGNLTVLRATTLRAPAAVRQALVDREIQTGAIRACLTARYNLLDLPSSRLASLDEPLPWHSLRPSPVGLPKRARRGFRSMPAPG